MNHFKKITAALAVTLASTTAMVSTNASAVNLATDEIGDVSVSPYYTTRAGWQTLINLTNTSNAPVVIRVRLHESHNSRDALDFLVTLSGFDQFVGLLRQGSNGFPVLVSTDQPNNNGLRTCTVPNALSNFAGSNQAGPSPEVRLNPAAFGVSSINGATDDNFDGGFVTGDPDDRLREGYIEFIVAGHAVGSNTGTVVDPVSGIINVGNAIEQHACAQVQTALTVGTNNTTGMRRIVESARQFGESINAIKFELRLLNGARGIETGSLATTWANFYNPGNGTGILPVGTGAGPFADPALVTPADNAACTITRGDTRDGLVEWLPGGQAGSCNNLISQQNANSFLDPSLNDAFPPVARVLDDVTDSAQTLTPTIASQAADLRFRGIDALSATILRSTVINSFADGNRANGGNVRTDWIVNFPTKGFYVDRAGEPVNASPAGGVFVGNQNAQVHDNDLVFGEQFAITDGRPGAFLDAAVSPTIPYAPFAQSFGPAANANANTAAGPFGPIVRGAPAANGQSCDAVLFSIYDRAEQTTAAPFTPADFSPAPPEPVAAANLCHEVNVITFNGNSALGNNLANTNPPANRLDIDTTGLSQPNFGWMFLDLTNGGNSTPLAVSRSVNGGAAAAAGLNGLPVIGFSIQQRNFGAVSANYASAVDHAFTRSATPSGF